MNDEFIPIAYTISNIVAVIMLACSWKYPALSRIIYFFMFGWAAFTNAAVAVNSPQHYLSYSQYAVLDSYINFIDGFFWSRMANVLGAFLLFLWPAGTRELSLLTSKARKRKR